MKTATWASRRGGEHGRPRPRRATAAAAAAAAAPAEAAMVVNAGEGNTPVDKKGGICVVSLCRLFLFVWCRHVSEN